MNVVLRIFMVLLALCLLLPGLCTFLFGGYFGLVALSSSSQNIYGVGGIAVPMLLIGGFFGWLGVMILIWTFRSRD